MSYAPFKYRSFHPLGPRALPLEQMPCELAHYTGRALAQVVDRALKEERTLTEGWGRAEYRILKILQVCGPVALTFLYERMGVSRQCLEVAMKKLSSGEWVRLWTDPRDLRVRTVCLSERAVELLERVDRRTHKIVEKARRRAGEVDFRAWLSFSRRLIAVTSDAFESVDANEGFENENSEVEEQPAQISERTPSKSSLRRRR